jgi:hypothetical protein
MNKYARKSNQSTTATVRTLALLIRNFLKGFDVVVHNIILEKVLSHDILIDAMPPYLHDIKTLKHNLRLIENFRFGLGEHMIGFQSFKLVMAKEIVCTLAAFGSRGSNKGTTRTLGVDRRNINKGVEKHMLLNTSRNVFWRNYQRRKCANALLKHIVELVIKWWKTKTTISPN